MKKYYLMIFAIATLAGMLAISGCKKKDTYMVTFNPNGGTGTMAAQTFTEGEAQALTQNAFTYDGYTFTGWNTVQGGSGASYPDGYTLTATADMTLYAQWEIITYTVTFESNGGTGDMPAQTFNAGESQSIATNVFTRDNYWFVGWNTTADGTGTSYNDRQSITVTENITLYAKWSLGVTGNTTGHNYVDLGLPSGTKWATCNVGASTPIAYGDYFAWGETEPKETYNWSTYRYCNGDFNTLTKYCDYAEYGNNGFTDNLTTLEASDDAATANWGSGWRMPTSAEMNELNSNCTVTWTTQNGVNGRLFTGPNGNSIFLPAAGFRDDSELYSAGIDGNYWSSSLDTDYTYYAWLLYFDSDECLMYNYYGSRPYGFSVRAVRP